MIPLLLPHPPLADERVVLRPLVEGDVADVVEGCRDPLVQRFTRVPASYTEDDARAFIGGAADRRAHGVSLELAIAGATDERLEGVIGLVRDRWDIERAEVGYWVAPRARGAGVASRALALLSRWALEEVGFARIDLQASVANPWSLRVAERCGYVREGRLRQAWYRGEQREDMVLFSLVDGDLAGPGA
jgi:RimJ/RimL family protein N-acetyltransferase